ncbi:hypothetical protein [Kordiimonas sp.]|uniref:hypothetical protein n=1 Tax=Kordiimonas sp. TaxID=1970157 RepID=UPI003A8E46AA
MQENALRSWHALGLKILIIGDEPGTGDIAAELSCGHIEVVERNSSHIPLIHDLFRTAHTNTDTPYLAYVNSDIILNTQSADAFASMLTCDADEISDFLYVARRRNIPLSEPIFTGTENWQDHIRRLDEKYGTWDDVFAIDVFMFNRGWLKDIPHLAVGRAGWDNWMLFNARQQGCAVIDGSHDCAVFHPLHGYSVTAGGLQAVTVGPQAYKNRLFCGDPICTIENSATHQQQAGRLNMVSTTPPCDPASYAVDTDKRFAADIRAIDRQLKTGTSAVQLADNLRTILWRAKVTVPALEQSVDMHAFSHCHQALESLLAQNRITEAIRQLQDYMGQAYLAKLQSITHDGGRPIYIWGKGEAALRLISFLDRHAIFPVGIIDGLKPVAHPEQYGQSKLPVLSKPEAEALLATAEAKPYVLIASVHYLSIAQTLESMELMAESDFL